MRTVALCVVVCLLLPSPAVALGQIGLTQAEKDRRYDPCLKVDNPVRCRLRQEQYADPALDKPAAPDREEFLRYRIRLRRFEINEREHRNTRLVQERRTLRSSGQTEDVNTSRVDYLQTSRQELIDCMLLDIPRLRSKCLVETRQRLRNASRAREIFPLGGMETAE